MYLCHLPFGQIALLCVAKRLQTALEALIENKDKVNRFKKNMVISLFKGNVTCPTGSTLEHFLFN